jgi:hypothetical protein
MTRAAIILALWLASLAGAAWKAYGAGRDSEIATQYREQSAAEKAAQAAQEGAARAIAGIEVQRVEITQPTITKIRETVRYVDCRHEPSVLRNVNAALTGRTEPASNSKLPERASAADR